MIAERSAPEACRRVIGTMRPTRRKSRYSIVSLTKGPNYVAPRQA
jgi:hypothetical protein